ncbi:MAG: hypothetical protein ACFFD1_00075 [Candidatus Thorarchaeota archaeon]
MAQVLPGKGDMGGLKALAGTRTGYLNIQSPKYQPFTGVDNLLSGVAGGIAAHKQDILDREKLNIDKTRNQIAFEDLKIRKNQENRAAQTFDIALNEKARTLAKQKSTESLMANQIIGVAALNMGRKDWEQNKIQWIQAKVNSGLISAEDGKRLASMSYDEAMRENKISSAIMTRGLAYQQYFKNKNSSTSSGTSGVSGALPGLGGNEIHNPETGEVIGVKDMPTNTNRTTFQKDILNAKENISLFDQTLNRVKPSMLGAKGTFDAKKLEFTNWVKGFTGYDINKGQKQWLLARQKINTQLQYLGLGIIKQLSGVQYSDNQLKFLQKIIPDLGDAEVSFYAKQDAVKNIFNNASRIREQILAEGYTYSTKKDSAYAKEYLKRLENVSLSLNEKKQSGEATINPITQVSGEVPNSAAVSGSVAAPQGQPSRVVTEGMLQYTLDKNKGMTRDQLLNIMSQHPNYDLSQVRK